MSNKLESFSSSPTLAGSSKRKGLIRSLISPVASLPIVFKKK